MFPASKGWRFKYRFNGRSRLISFGIYPDVSLELARQRRQEARELLARGIDPVDIRNAPAEHPVGETVAELARQWIDVASGDWAEGHARMIRSRMERYVLPALGSRLIAEVTTKDVLEALRPIEAIGYYETAHRVRSIIGQIFLFALASGTDGVTGNPAAGLGRALRSPAKRHMSAILDPVELGRLLRDSDGYPGAFQVRCALQLAPLLFVRPGELRQMQWAHIDMAVCRWTIPAGEMKMKVSHVVQLSKQARQILDALRPLTGHMKYVFAGRQASRPMSPNTINMALRAMGWGPEKVTGHEFRATARTMLHETLGFSPDAIEAQLAHAVPDRLGGAYNRTQHLEERTRMMQAWADYLDGLKEGAQ